MVNLPCLLTVTLTIGGIPGPRTFRGPYLVTRAFLPLLFKGGDKQIVFVSSVGSFLKSPNQSAYQASKLALLRFAEFLSAEYGDKGVHPGNIPGTDILGPGGVPEGMKHSKSCSKRVSD